MEATITVETLTGASPSAGSRFLIMRSKGGKMKPTQSSKLLAAATSYLHARSTERCMCTCVFTVVACVIILNNRKKIHSRHRLVMYDDLLHNRRNH